MVWVRVKMGWWMMGKLGCAWFGECVVHEGWSCAPRGGIINGDGQIVITVSKTNDWKPIINGRPLFSLRNNGPESSGR